MNVRASKPVKSGGRRPPATVDSGAITGAQRDPDVAQLVCAEVEARAADHQVKIALAAYFIAERRGFEPGHELDDWLAAEAQIAAAEQPSVTRPIPATQAGSIS